MSRSGYIDDYDYDGSLNLYRGSVERAMRGKRGQLFFHDLVDALDAMAVKELVADELETPTGNVCALGALGKVRGIDMTRLDPEDAPRVGDKFGIAPSLAREVVYENDENGEGKHKSRVCPQCHGWGEVAGMLGHPMRCISCQSTGRRWKYLRETPAERWTRMRAWAVSHVHAHPRLDAKAVTSSLGSGDNS